MEEEAKRYICRRPCWHGTRRWHLGDLAIFMESELPRGPKGEIAHFELLDAGVAPRINEIVEPVPNVIVNKKGRRIR